MQVAFESISASDKTLVYDHETRSNEIVHVPIVTLYYDESNLVPPSTTTTIGLFTRDPIGYEGSEWKGNSKGTLLFFGLVRRICG